MSISKVRQPVLFLVALAFAFVFTLWHRTPQTMEYLNGRFSGYDSYIYFRQAERIVEEGRLPERDMERWLPFGRDLTLLHNLYSYALAHSYRAVRAVFPDLTLYEYCCYVPPVLFAATVALLTAVLWTLFGWEAGGLGGLFLIFIPAGAYRTTLGFADRDAFCLFLGVLTGALYLWQVNALTRRRQIVLAGACGLTAAVGCLGWEGSSVFALCVLVPSTVSAWRQQNRVLEMALFNICLMLPLLLFSSKYRFWIDHTEPAHPIGLVTVYPALLALSLILIRQTYRKQKGRKWKIASFLPATALLVYLSTRMTLANSALSFAVPFSNSRLMQKIGETIDMRWGDWYGHYGALIPVVVIGAVCSWVYWIRKYRSDGPTDRLAEPVGNMLLFGTAWIVLWGSLTQGAMRYAIMLTPGIAAWGCIVLTRLGYTIATRLRKKFLAAIMAYSLFATGLPAAILLWMPLGGLAYASSGLARPMYALPVPKLYDAMRWMSRNLERTGDPTIVAADWLYGVHLNVIADAATIVDTDTWKHYWIHLVARHLLCAESELEALQFLKTRDAKYWMLTSFDVTDRVRMIEYLASGVPPERDIDFSKNLWDRGGSEAFELVFENEEVKLFRIHYPSDLTVSPELYEAWTAPNFPDPELRRVWMGG